jgi:hypothetical protein
VGDAGAFIDASGGRSTPAAIIAEAAEELFTKYHLRILHGRRYQKHARSGRVSHPSCPDSWSWIFPPQRFRLR